jgi:hypothetical protein
MKKYTLDAKKGWRPSVGLDLTLDFCQIALGADNPLINIFAPGIRKYFGLAIQPCPFEVCVPSEPQCMLTINIIISGSVPY